MEFGRIYLRYKRAVLLSLMFKVGLFCSVSADVCLSSPCQNNSTCVPALSGYLCVCSSAPPIHTGVNCERLLDPCESSSCPSDCVGVPGTENYTCVCPDGFDGPYCTRNIDECESNPCTGVQSFCVDGENGFSCHCPSGYAGDACETKVRDCSDQPCFNNASCVWALGGYECQCVAGFRGPNCEEDIDECVSQPCLNGALCLDGVDAYHCYCVPGFQGYHCDIDINECASQPCENNGTCVNGRDRYVCECLIGFTGVNCEVEVDECEVNPCQNGATCHDHVGLHTCECVPGFEGINCELDIDECLSSPCLHGGACVDLISGFACDCSGTGFVGSLCDVDILECSSDPCLHGAPCLEGVNQYSCLCWPGYDGENCELDVDECVSHPCENGGECFQRSDSSLYRVLPELDHDFSFESAAGFLCHCAAGFTGENCSIEVNECESAPCWNGGSCEDLLNAFHCSCPAGFTGVLCELNVDECESGPCQNGGRCEDGVNAYTCHCAPPTMGHLPWGGPNCDVLLSGCVDAPCQNNATCLPSLHGHQHHYTCECPPGYNGDQCQTPTTFSMTTGGYIVVDVPHSNRSRRDLGRPGPSVHLRFRTTLRDTLIFYRGTPGHFFLLELIGGNLSSRAESGDLRLSVMLDGEFSDGSWRDVWVRVDERLTMATEDQTVEDGGHNHLLSFQTQGLEKLYVGGAPQEFLNGTGFAGCLEDLLVDSTPVLPQSFDPRRDIQVGCERTEWCRREPCSERGRCVDLWTSYSCVCHRPFYGHNCSQEHASWTFSPERNRSFAAFPIMQRHNMDVTVSFLLRSRSSSGLVLQLQRDGLPYFSLFLHDGSLQVNTSGSTTTTSSLLTDGHKVFVSVKPERGVVTINQTQQTLLHHSALEVEPGDVVYLGGLPEGENSAAWGGYFKGCLQDVRIDDTQLFMYTGSISQKPQHATYLPRNSSNVLEGCVGDLTCKMKPCQNGGKCRVVWNDFLCSCPLNFSGKTCETRVWCRSDPCEAGSRCVDLPDGYECLSNGTFESNALQFSADGSLRVPVRRVSVSLRTRAENGTVLRCSGGLDFFCLGLLHSSIIVKIRSGSSRDIQAFTSTIPVSDGEWHEVEVFTSGSRWHIFVDGRASGSSPTPTGHLSFFNSSVVKLAENYTGCLGEVRIAGVYLPYFGNNTEAPQASRFTRVGGTEPHLGCISSVCDSNPCLNNGSCMDLFQRFSCRCVPGWTGEHCERDEDECERRPCIRGTCRNLPGRYECMCPVGFGGQDCGVERDGCQERPCLNGGSCVRTDTGHVCVCTPDRTGPSCQWRFPPLHCDVDLQCENGGVCTEGSQGANCTCRPGFTGDRCEVDVDECESDPCLNGGTCVNRRNRFICECVPEFSGEICQNTRALQQDGVPWLLISVPLACVSILLLAVGLVFLLITARKKRQSEGTYSPSMQEVSGARLEMGSVLKLPPEERLI